MKPIPADCEQNPPQPTAGHQKSLSVSVSPRKAWIWTALKEKAAKLVAADDLTDEQIAKECGTCKRQLERWKHAEQFQARVQEVRERYRAQVLDSRYCRKEQRILVRQQLIDKCLKIIQDRSQWPGMEKIPGGTTGLVIPQVRSLAGKIVTEYETDTATEQIIRSNLREIAREIGDWKSINDAAGGGEGNTPSKIVFQVTNTQMAVAGDRIVDVEAVPTD